MRNHGWRSARATKSVPSIHRIACENLLAGTQSAHTRSQLCSLNRQFPLLANSTAPSLHAVPVFTLTPCAHFVSTLLSVISDTACTPGMAKLLVPAALPFATDTGNRVIAGGVIKCSRGFNFAGIEEGVKPFPSSNDCLALEHRSPF